MGIKETLINDIMINITVIDSYFLSLITTVKDEFFKDKCENTRKYYISKLQDLSQSLLNDDDIDVNKTEQYMSEIQSARKDALEAFKSYTYMGI